MTTRSSVSTRSSNTTTRRAGGRARPTCRSTSTWRSGIRCRQPTSRSSRPPPPTPTTGCSPPTTPTIRRRSSGSSPTARSCASVEADPGRLLQGVPRALRRRIGTKSKVQENLRAVVGISHRSRRMDARRRAAIRQLHVHQGRHQDLTGRSARMNSPSGDGGAFFISRASYRKSGGELLSGGGGASKWIVLGLIPVPLSSTPVTI